MSLLKTTPDEYLPRGSLREVQYTGLSVVDALLGRDYWVEASKGTLQLSYSFVQVGSRFDDTSEEVDSAMPLPVWVMDLVRDCLALVQRYIDIDFIEVQETANTCGVIRFAGLEGGSSEMAAYAYMPSNGPWGGDVFIFEDQFDQGESDYLKSTLLHEIGHALGLKHPFEAETYNPIVLSKDMDQISLTLMSYTDLPDLPDEFLLNYPETLMPLDIFALQYLYGTSKSSMDNDVYDLSRAEFDGFYALFDSGGVDTLDASRVGKPVILSLLPSVWSDIGIKVGVSNGTFFSDTFILVETFIENVIGTAFDDLVQANSLSNQMSLGDGHDAVLWDAPLSAFKLGFNQGVWLVSETANPGNLDSLIDTERLVFADREIQIEATPHDSFADVPNELYQFFIVAFNAAPGVTYLNQLAEAYRYGLSVREIVDVFTTKSQFTDLYPADLSINTLSERLVANVVKDSASEVVRSEAVKDIKEAFAAGLSRAEVIYNVFGNLAKMPESDVKWGKTAALFKNEVTVAKIYSEVMDQSTTDLHTLRSALSAVTPTSDLSSDDLAIEIIIAGLTSERLTALGQSRLTQDPFETAHLVEAEWTLLKPWIDPIAIA